MNRLLLFAFAALLGLLAVDQARKLFPAGAAIAARAGSARPGPAPETRSASSLSPAADSAPSAVALIARAEARRLLQRSRGVTYVDSLFAETDSILRRWPDPGDLQLVVAVAQSEEPTTAARLRWLTTRALRTWQDLAPAVRFVLNDDTTGAMIIVRSVERLEGERAGQTDLSWTRDGAIHSALITVALHTADGTPVSDEGLFAVTSHEVGHALGLPHSSDSLDVMYPTTRTGAPTERDARSMRLLYELPLGSVKGTPPE